MKRALAGLLVLLFALSPCGALAAQAADGQGGQAALCAFDSRLLGAVRQVLSDETVLQARQSAVLYAEGAQVTSAALSHCATAERQSTLSAGDTVRVFSEGAYLKICTTVTVEEEQTAPDGTTHRAPVERSYETRTFYLSAATEFTLLATDSGLCLLLHAGSLTHAYTKDAFSCSEVAVHSGALRVFCAENYFTVGRCGDEGAVFCLAGKRALSATLGEQQLSFPALSGAVFAGEQQTPLASPLSVTEDAQVLCMASLCEAMTENSAVADGAARAAAALGQTDVNAVWERFEAHHRRLLIEAARTYPDAQSPRRALCLTAAEFAAGSMTPAETVSSTQWSLTYPASCAAYTVRDAGKRINLAAVRAEEVLEVALTLSVGLVAAEDVLQLLLGELVFDITRTEGESTYVFEVPAGELKALYAADASERSFSVRYETKETHLFLESGGGYTFSEEALAPVRAGEAVTLQVSLSGSLLEGDELYLVHRTAEGQVQVAPTATGAPDTYQFTVTPAAGVNVASVCFSSVHSLHLENALCEFFAPALLGTAGAGLVATGAVPRLVLTRVLDCEYVPVVLQTMGGRTHALSADARGDYPLLPVTGDTTLSLALGYPVTLPADTELYSVRPEEGFSPDYAPVGGEYRFKVRFDQDAALGTSLLVKNNGVTITPNSDGVFIIAEVTQPVRIQVAHGVTYNVFLPTGDAFAVTPYGGDGTTVLENGTFRFTLQLPQATTVSQLIVAANESVLTPDASGIYTVSGITRDVYITVRLISSFRVTLPVGDGYTVVPYGDSDVTVLSGGNYSFTVQTDESVLPGSELTVYADDALLTPEEGIYTIRDIQKDVYVTVRLRRALRVILPPSGPLYTVTADKQTVLYGEGVVVRVSAQNREVTVKANGQVLTGEQGIYEIAAVYHDLYITVEGALEATCTVTLAPCEGVVLSALSSPVVALGGEHIFSATAAAELWPSVQVTPSSGVLDCFATEERDGRLVRFYRLSDVREDATVSFVI